MKDQTSKPKIRFKRVIAVLTLVVAAAAAFAAFLALKKNDDTQGIIFNIKQVLGMSSRNATVTPPNGHVIADPPPTSVVATPPSEPKVQPELPMDRLSSDTRLSMALISLKPVRADSRDIIATYVLRSIGEPSQPFVLLDNNREGWSVDGGRAGHCYQTRESGLDSFYRNYLDAKIGQLLTLSDGKPLYIRAELYCDGVPALGETAVATATPYVLSTDGSKTALPIRFQSGPTPITP